MEPFTKSTKKNKPRISPSSYSPQTSNRCENSRKLQEHGLIWEKSPCRSFNKIVRSLLIVSYWKQTPALPRDHHLCPWPHGCSWYSLEALTFSWCIWRGHPADTFHLDSYPTHPRKNSLMSNQPSWKWSTHNCFTQQLVLQPAHRSLNCTVYSHLYSKTCIFSLLQQDLEVPIDFRLQCTCHWYKQSIHLELYYQTDCAFRLWINGSFHHKHELVIRSSRR